MSNIPAEHRSCDHTLPKDQQVDVIVENNPAELQGACREVLQALTLRAALVSSVDPCQCVEAPQSYSLLTQAPYNFTFRTGNTYLLDSCRIWVFKSMAGQTDADTGDIDIKDLLMYPRQERKTCVLSTGATCVVTISVAAPRASASMTRVPPRLENAVPWGLRTAADNMESLVQEGSETFPAPLEGRALMPQPVAPAHHPGVGIYLQASNRGHTRSLSPVPRTVWGSTTSRLVAPPVTSLPTPMAATRSSTMSYQASPVSRRSPLAPEHPRLATYTSSGLAYSAIDSAPAIRVTPITHNGEMIATPALVGLTATTSMPVSVSSGRRVKLSVSSTGSHVNSAAVDSAVTSTEASSSAVACGVESTRAVVLEAQACLAANESTTSLHSPPKPAALVEGSTEILSPGELTETASRHTDDVVDLEQGSAGRRDKVVGTEKEKAPVEIGMNQSSPPPPAAPEKLIVTATDKVEMYTIGKQPLGVETMTTTEPIMSQVESATYEEDEDEAEQAEEVATLKEQGSQESQMEAKGTSTEGLGRAREKDDAEEQAPVSELQRDIRQVIEKDEDYAPAEASLVGDTRATTQESEEGVQESSIETKQRVFEMTDFWTAEDTCSLSKHLDSPALAADGNIAIVSADTKIIRCDHKSICFSVFEATAKEDFSEPFSWHFQHKNSPDAVIPGFIKAPWDVCMTLMPTSVLRISVELTERGTYASGILDIPKMIISEASVAYGTVELFTPEGSHCSTFTITAQLRLLKNSIPSSPIVNLGKTYAPPRYNTCVLQCSGVEDGAPASTVNTYKIGVGMNNNINTYVLVDNSSSSARSGSGICLNIEDLEEKIITMDVHKIQSTRGKAQERIFLGNAKFDLNELINDRITTYSGALEIHDGNVKLHGTTLKIDVTLEDEVEEEETETLTDVYVKSTIMKSMTLTSQRTSPQLDNTYHKLRSVIEEIPAAKAKRKMIDVLKEVPVARHKKLMTKVVKEVPVAQAKKKMVPVLEDITKRPFRKCMSSVVEELHHNKLKKAMQPVIEEVPLQPMKRTFRKLCSEIPSAVEHRSALKKSLSSEDPYSRSGLQARLSKESIVEITEEPCVMSVGPIGQPSRSSIPISHRTTDSEDTVSTSRDTSRQKRVKSSTSGSLSSMTTPATSGTANKSNVTANDIAGKITKAINEDPACAAIDPALVIKMLEIFRNTLRTSSNQTIAPSVKEAAPLSKDAAAAAPKESTSKVRSTSSRTSLAKSGSLKSKGSWK